MQEQQAKQQPKQQTKQEQIRSSNLRLGLILASVALAFFAGIFVKHAWFN